MNTPSNSQHSQDSHEPHNPTNLNHSTQEKATDPQPESGFIDREEQMNTRQSSPTNPRVNEKSETNQEEA